LIKKKANRLGASGGIKEILTHPFFESLDIEKLKKKELVPDYQPDINEGELKYFDQKLVNDTEIKFSEVTANRQKMIDKNKDLFAKF
jgi:hypothetical protein